MKDLGDASYVLGIQIIRDKANGVLSFSQMTYIDRVLKRFNMQSYSPGKALIAKCDKFSSGQCPKNDSKRNQMKIVSYASTICSLMYSQVCTHLDIAFVDDVLGRYLSDLGLSRWRVVST